MVERALVMVMVALAVIASARYLGSTLDGLYTEVSCEINQTEICVIIEEDK